VLGAVFGSIIGLGVAWLLMFSSTLHLMDVGSHPVSFAKSAAAGAIFFGTAGLVLGSHLGSLIGRVIAAMYEFERLYDGKKPLVVELVLALIGILTILWANGVFTA